MDVMYLQAGSSAGQMRRPLCHQSARRQFPPRGSTEGGQLPSARLPGLLTASLSCLSYAGVDCISFYAQGSVIKDPIGIFHSNHNINFSRHFDMLL